MKNKDKRNIDMIILKNGKFMPIRWIQFLQIQGICKLKILKKND